MSIRAGRVRLPGTGALAHMSGLRNRERGTGLGFESAPFCPSIKMCDVIHVRPPTPHGCAFLTADLCAMRKKVAAIPAIDRAAFFERRKTVMSDATTHARDCRAWEASFQADLRSRRIPLIREKLLSLGWGDELKVLGSQLDRLPLVAEPIELTESAWVVLQPSLEEYLAEVREREEKNNDDELRAEEKMRLKLSKALERQKRQHRKSRR
ncbi:hypothetical protein MVEN_02209600 [Mycena venus]|uniref:Uncharacterized protein n=1 Tax=Mycena venus TaxID=2733690 RepID=A0A8H6X7K7_9AGAR|nr:hypothetical protein MVEN_02209600 [Mycena venus]